MADRNQGHLSHRKRGDRQVQRHGLRRYDLGRDRAASGGAAKVRQKGHCPPHQGRRRACSTIPGVPKIGLLTPSQACIAADADSRGRSPSRSEEHTSELQSLMRISYAVFFLKKKKQTLTTSY